MIDFETLLQPVSDENPCGEDISYDPKFLELDTLIAGKLETQFSSAEEADWNAVRDTCLELFAKSKHLRVAVLLCLALVKKEGAPGLRDGLNLLKGLLERYWPDLFPKLDPAENNDPLERINITSALSTPLGTYGDPVRFLERIRRMPLAILPQLGPISMANLAGEKPAAGTEAQAPAASPAQIATALRTAPSAEIEATYMAVAESIGLVSGIDDFLTQSVGADKSLDMGALLGTLNEIQKALAPFVKSAVLETADGSNAGGEEARGGSGGIASRRDVLHALDQICEYYARSESSSPVPLLLQRARRLVDMDFVQIVNELAPDALGQIATVTGYRGGGQSAGGEAAEST